MMILGMPDQEAANANTAGVAAQQREAYPRVQGESGKLLAAHVKTAEWPTSVNVGTALGT